ncbi:MAG: hypothetical protein ACR2FO_05665 [Actinomycetota bacterium]
MSRRDLIILRAASLWTLWIWGTRIFNILQDDSRTTAFKAVHSALAMVSVAFAIAIWFVAGNNRKPAA